MNQFRLISLPLLISFVCVCERGVESRRILWQQRTNIGDALNWEDERIPCASDALLFPQKSYDLIKLSNFSMSEIILPKSGGFLLDTQTSLSFRERDPKCVRSRQMRAFKSLIVSPWLASANWQSQTVNRATPHDERVPCDADEVVFPVNSSYAVDLQSLPSLSFASVAVDGRVMSPGEFRDFLFSSVVGQASFKNFDGTQFLAGECRAGQVCPCHRRSAALREQLCANERPFCEPTPHCTDPITPLGHCCAICGAMFHMLLNSGFSGGNGNRFDLEDFKSRIDRAIDGATGVDRSRIVYHVGVTMGNATKEQRQQQRTYLQLIIVDRLEYDAVSSRLMEHLRQTILAQLYQSQSKFYFASGMPFTPNASGHVLTFIFGTLALVSLFMTLIYVVYYDDRHIPRLMAVIRNRRFMQHSDVIFARFDNSARRASEHAMVAGESGSASVVEVDLHFGTDQSIENVNRAFNNPMFDAKLKEEEADEAEEVEVEGGRLGNDADGIKEEKL